MSTVSWDDSIRRFLQQAGSASPTPGGGSVAALVAALGAAMTTMVGNLSQGEKFAQIQPQVAEVIGKMERLSADCEQLLAADIASFHAYMEAVKLPKETDEEKDKRKEAMDHAVVHAIEVPLRLMEVCQLGLEYAHSIAESCNKNVMSDLGIGAVLFEAAAQSALLTVEINLAAGKDVEWKRPYSEKASGLMNEIREQKSKVWQIAETRIRQR